MNRIDPSIVSEARPARAVILVMPALCALLGASTAATGAAIGIALFLTVSCSVLVAVSVRQVLPSTLQAAAFVVIFAGCVTAADLLLHGGWPELYRRIAFFLPVTLAAGPLLAASEIFAAFRTKTEALKRAVVAGLVLACTATLLGGLRQLVGSGISEGPGFLLALLPPGAFIATGILLAGWNWFAERRS